MFESLGEKIVNLGSSVKSGTVTAFENTKRGVNNFSETVSLKNKIENARKNIKSSYGVIGEKFYNENKDNAPAGYEDAFNAIAMANKAIAEAEEQIAKLSDTVVCPSCGAKVNKENAFCSNCGFKMPEQQPEAEAKPEVKICASCGKEIPADAAFCNHCGTKVE